MKIGLIGAENSHTIGFCEAINNKKKYPGFEITHVFGDDSTILGSDACAKLVEKYGLTEVKTLDEIIALTDALVITYRKGSLHYEPSMKVLKAGKPLYNDKPFTTCPDQALEIVEYAKNNNLLLCGGSTVKSLSGLSVLDGKIGAGSTVVVGYRADPDSEYDGFWFYGIHAVETFVRLMGQGYKSVSACKSGKDVVASVNYGDRRGVIINSPDATEVYVSVMNGDKSETFVIANDYVDIAPEQFITMLKTGKPPFDYSFYADSIKLMADIIDSAKL